MISSAHARLRTATRDDHRRLDAHFPDGLPDARAYRMYLRGMHRFVADMAAVLGPAPEAGSEALLALCSGAHAALAADLWDLRVAPLPPSSSLPHVGTGAARLGWEYVLAGSAMGARLLRAQAARLGHGENPPPVAESGPTEIRSVARAFNQMTEDLQKGERERATFLAGIFHERITWFPR